MHHRSFAMYAFASPFNSSVIQHATPPYHLRVPFSASPTTSPICSSSRSLALSRESLCCLPSASRFNVFSCVSLPRAYSSSRILPGSFCAPLSPFFREGDANVFPCSARCNTCRRSCTPRVRRALKLCAQLRAPRSHKRIGDAHGAPGKCIARLRRESGLQDYRMRQPAARPHSAALLPRFLPFFLSSLSLCLSLSLFLAVGANDGTKWLVSVAGGVLSSRPRWIEPRAERIA